MNRLNILKPSAPEVIDDPEDDIDDIEEEEDDVWAAGEYGYADMLVGTETWEDQVGMEKLKADLKIPDDWFLKGRQLFISGRAHARQYRPMAVRQLSSRISARRMVF